MPDDVFRIVIAAAVAMACIAVIVQAIAIVAFYGAIRKVQDKFETLSLRAEPLLARLDATLERSGPLMEKIEPMMDGLQAAIRRAGPVLDKAVPVLDQARQVLVNTNLILETARPRVSEVSAEVVEIARETRAQVERIGTLIHNAGDRARHRLEQIDQTVESTVEQVEQVGDSVKRAVMRPVREANGLAAGISRPPAS